MRASRGGAARWALALLAGAAVATTGAARAAEPTKSELAAARDLFSRAERDEDAGRWADALEKLRRAATVKMTAGMRFHIALCEEKLGQLVAALADYTAADAAARAEGNKDVLDALADALVAVRARVPTLTITPPDGARDLVVLLDGAPLAAGLVGTPVPVDVGAHAVQAHATGRAPFAVTVNVFERQAASVEVRMPPAAGDPIPAAQAIPGPAPARGSPSTGTAASPGSTRTAAILTTGGAAVLVGFGVAAYVVAGGKQTSAEAACLQVVSCDDLKGGVRTWDALALAGWIAGGAAAALSVYLWTRPSAPDDGPHARLDLGPQGIRLHGEF